MNCICIYPGRFQPFGPHHFKSYQWLVRVFGIENVYLVTSNHQDENSPLTFDEKKQCIEQYNINQNHIVQVKNPYRAEELIQRFDPNNTSAIFAYGEKDFGRIKFQKSDGSDSYFKEFFGQRELKPLSKCGYVVEMPNQHVTYQGKEINGTYLREMLPMLNPEEFREIMGYYDSEIHFLFKKKFHPDINELVESIIIFEGNVTRTQLQRIEQYADKLFQSYGIDINFQDILKGTHFWHRVNDPRNIKPITTDELRQLFKKASIKFGSKLSQSPSGFEAVLKDIETDINLPFMLRFDSKNNELDLIPKTIMRKKNFTDKNKPLLTMETVIKKYTKHIQHLYEDQSLTEDDYLEFIDILLVHPERLESCSLKLDGHNLKVTFKNGRILSARNKGNIIDPISILELKEKYKDKPDIQFVFVKAMEDIGNGLLKLGTRQLDKIFNNGRTFLNFEVLHPKAQNVFNYGEPLLSLHSLITYDGMGNELNSTTDLPFNLINGRVFKIQKSPNIQLQPLNNFKIVEFLKSKIKTGSELKETILLLENVVVQNFCKRFQATSNSSDLISKVHRTKNLIKSDADRKKYEEGMRLINSIGGIEQVNPIEGLVFKYKGREWKCTGFFGCCTPILNIYNKDRFQKK